MSAAVVWPWMVLWLAGAGAKFLRSKSTLLSWCFPVAGLVLLWLQSAESAGWKLLAASLLFLFLMKGAVLAITSSRLSGVDLAIFLSVWPGMNPDELSERREPQAEAGARFVRGLLLLFIGLGCIVGLALVPLSAWFKGWLGLFAVLLTVHFGLSEILTSVLQFAGRPVKPLFDLPLASSTLREFWTSRWNRPFVDMNRRLFMPSLTRRLGLKGAVVGAFLVSGALHEMAISYPVGGGWGGPMLYFALQAVLVLAEKGLRVRSRLFTWASILVPLPLLFHSSFRETFIIGGLEVVEAALTARPLEWWLSLHLTLVGIAHFLVPIASFQVPLRLRWREELPRLSNFNRKLMWTFGAYTLLAILSFGILTLIFRDSFLRGEPLALGLAAYILVFWGSRLVVDKFYYHSGDWPEGPQFVAGHALLNALIAFLASGYLGVLAYHWSR